MHCLFLLPLLFAPFLSQNLSADALPPNHSMETISEEDDHGDQLYLSININDGAKLQLSNGSIYEIAPEDRIFSAYWITPFPIMLSESGDPDYPTKITNMNSGTFVRGKQLIASEVIEEEIRRRLEKEQQIKKEFHPPDEKGKPAPQPQPEATPEPSPDTTTPDTTPKPATPPKKPSTQSSTTSAILKQNHINL